MSSDLALPGQRRDYALTRCQALREGRESRAAPNCRAFSLTLGSLQPQKRVRGSTPGPTVTRYLPPLRRNCGPLLQSLGTLLSALLLVFPSTSLCPFQFMIPEVTPALGSTGRGPLCLLPWPPPTLCSTSEKPCSQAVMLHGRAHAHPMDLPYRTALLLLGGKLLLSADTAKENPKL